MEQFKIGSLVTFESFGKPKTEITGEIVKIFVSKKDNKQYCQVKSKGKLYCKQLQKIKTNN